MKATLSFTLPDEREEFENCVSADGYRAVIEELSNWLRAKVKYAIDLPSTEIDAYDKAREELFRLVDEFKVTIS